jgi:hypothetical protein
MAGLAKLGIELNQFTGQGKGTKNVMAYTDQIQYFVHIETKLWEYFAHTQTKLWE